MNLPAVMRSPSGLPQIAALILVCAANWIVFPDFFALELRDGRLFGSVIDVLNRGAPVAILAIGMTLVIATRGIDLSVGAVMAIAGATAATLTNAGYGLPTVLGGALATGLACGLWNGLLVAVLRIQPIVATLILMVAGRGIAQLITEGAIVTFGTPELIAIGSGSVLGLPSPVIIMIGLLAVSLVLVRATALGLFLEAVGLNERSSAYAGVDVRTLTLTVYIWSGLCAAIAGVIAAADIRGADANNAGLWLELDAILAVVVGGTSLLGGRFSLAFAVMGALIIQAMNTGILLSGFRPEFNLLVKAVVVLLVLLPQSPAIARRFARADTGKSP